MVEFFPRLFFLVGLCPWATAPAQNTNFETENLDKEIAALEEELITLAKAANLEGINVNYKGLSNEVFIEKVHAAGLELFTWTVNSPTEARRLANLGLKGITTDRPAWLRAQIK